MAKRLFLLDGMALVYRAHFALVARPIFNSRGINTSALFVFTQTLLDILKNRQPTHLAVAFDTEAPTQRHREFPDYKIQREAMPEDIAFALPAVRRMLEAFHIPALICDGYEADDIIGTLVRRAEREGFESYMVTPDKDFSQLVSERTLLFKPSRMGDAVEILGVPEIRAKWGVSSPEQVIDIIGLWGDTSDNIPGVPGIGEKTASKLIAEYGSIENLLAHSSELKGKLRENLETHRDQAVLSKRLATICCEVPLEGNLDDLQIRPPNEPELKQLLAEFEFNSIGRRLFGEDYKASAVATKGSAPPAAFHEGVSAVPAQAALPASPGTVTRVAPELPRNYRRIETATERAALLRELGNCLAVSLSVSAAGDDPRQASLRGLAFATRPQTGYFVPLPGGDETARVLEEFRPLLESETVEKTGYNLKFDLSVLQWHGVAVGGWLFDVMLAHILVEPDVRHTLERLAGDLLGYHPEQAGPAPGETAELPLGDRPQATGPERAVEIADLAGQLRPWLEGKLREMGQEKVFYEIEAPLLPVLVDMEIDGVRIDARALDETGEHLRRIMSEQEKAIYQLAGREFNLNSPKQLGEILFEGLRIADNPKKTATGQYATDEQTLSGLAADHEIVRRLLEFRMCSKLKSTYVDTLPGAIFTKTGRVHTTYHQLATATGRLNSQNPNLQNIPIRSDLGQEIRRAFVARDSEHLILSADYSQIELRIIAALTQEPAMLDAFRANIDIHSATAARVFGVLPELATPEMRKQAKMVNYGIAYGISAFGLAQRLGIPRREAARIIDQYFAQFAGIRQYMSDTVEFARQNGYVQTVTGRRRYLRDIRSSNATLRNAAERNAINAPIQGTAADMIKLAMVQIHRELKRRRCRSCLILQVHDELVLDVYRPELDDVRALVEDKMKHAIPLEVPMVVEIGTGRNWIEAH